MPLFSRRPDGLEGAAQRNQEIARAMLAKGYDVQSILELTGIDMSQGTASAS